MEQRFGKQIALMLICFGNLYIGGIFAAFHQLRNPRGGVLP